MAAVVACSTAPTYSCRALQQPQRGPGFALLGGQPIGELLPETLPAGPEHLFPRAFGERGQEAVRELLDGPAVPGPVEGVAIVGQKLLGVLAQPVAVDEADPGRRGGELLGVHPPEPVQAAAAREDSDSTRRRTSSSRRPTEAATRSAASRRRSSRYPGT